MDENLIPKGWEKRGNILTVIGVGGGGGNAVTYMYEQGIQDVDFIVCNTDKQALEMSSVPMKLPIGEITTHGLGAGTDYLVGRKAAEESIDEIRKCFSKDTRMVFVTCGMGGGTGTGAAPVIAKVAKEMDALTVGVVTIPFRDEGEESMFRAVQGIKELSKNVDCTLIIDNQKLYDLHSDLTVFNAFPKADEVLATAVKSIVEIITSRGYINVDFADVRKVMLNSGVALMGIGEASGENRAKDAIELAFKSPLLTNMNLSSAKSALINISSTSDDKFAVTMPELNQMMEYTKSNVPNIVNFKRGIVKNDELGEKVKVTIIATGYDMAQLPSIEEPKSHRGVQIKVRVAPGLTSPRKTGTPTISKNEVTLNKRHSTEKPGLLSEDPHELLMLETEAAYYRREKILNQENKEQ